MDYNCFHEDIRVVTAFNNCFVDATFRTYLDSVSGIDVFFKHYTDKAAAVFVREDGDHSWRLIPVRKLPPHVINELIDEAEYVFQRRLQFTEE